MKSNSNSHPIVQVAAMFREARWCYSILKLQVEDQPAWRVD